MYKIIQYSITDYNRCIAICRRAICQKMKTYDLPTPNLSQKNLSQKNSRFADSERRRPLGRGACSARKPLLVRLFSTVCHCGERR